MRPIQATRDAGLTGLRAAMLACLLLLAGCSTLGYVGHLGKGQLALWRQQQPVSELLASPTTNPALREQLELLSEARDFASERLLLPRNRSYTRYVALDRDYVSWVVIAAPEFSLDPIPLCLPIAGCVPYRGYFERGLAQREAARLAARGFDTWVGGVSAYSTLGWFADPLLSSMLREGADAAVATMFHELAHQWLYVPDDTRFNESLASFVEQQGLREWRGARKLPNEAEALQAQRLAQRIEMQTLIETLQALYASPLSDAAKRHAKAEVFDEFRRRQTARRTAAKQHTGGFDGWIDGQLNNAALQPHRLYDGWLPAFARLFHEKGEDWAEFRVAVQALARLPRGERDRRLEALARSSDIR